ncbi:RNA polymerase sigma-70 factor (ECF subfamily) [Variovorax boronicumulans]|uniref:sigma-70 family RNA polymerase sigma factor n=1 Tax=Variovorax boronicumulans TaxID=436515 RepID=UPI0027884C6E|nr:sigma-70 family RNA polymerase sigma factor [Variovorax boronicumulans]MDP9992331.1 RNA polymerase sigma-70 factor (ECF subfamily) [Variovorax boronicumulans]MDQ0002497.1 RNA polymerase sigma-70 factor (ECF subfamily) [Variovorax boronicumulans]
MTLQGLWQAAPMLDERYLSQLPALRSRLVRAAARMLGGQAEAEDVVQDTYLRALEAGDQPTLDAAQAWLTTVMQHLAIDRLRRRNWMQQWLSDAKASAAPPETASTEDRAAMAQEIDRALHLLATRLSPADGAAVLLREVFEASFKEIAEASGKTEAACRQQLHRALLRLRQDDRDVEERGADAVFHVYRQALHDCDARTLFAMLRQPPTRALAMSAATSPRSDAPRVVCQVMQIGGQLGLVLTLGGKVLCVLPLEAWATQDEPEAALSRD